MPKKQRELLEDEKAEKLDSPPSEAPTSQTSSAAGSMLKKNPKTKDAVYSLEIEETVKTEETLETKDLNSSEKTSEYSKYAEKSSISEIKTSRCSEDPSDNRETRSDKSFTKSGDLDSNLCIIKGSSGSIEKLDDQDFIEKDRQEENQNSTEKEGSKLGRLDDEKDRIPKKQREFLEDKKAEEVDSPHSEAPKTKGSSGSIEKRDDQDSTEKDRQESFEQNQNSTKKEGSKLGPQEKIASKGKSKGQFISLKEIKILQETAKDLILGNNLAKALGIIRTIEDKHPPKYSAMVYGWKASVLFDEAKKLLMKDWSNIPKARDPARCYKMLQNSLENAEKAAELFPNCLEFTVVMCQTLQYLKEYQRVKEHCDRALSLKPTELVNKFGGPVKMEEAEMQTKALEKMKKSAEQEISKANAIDSANSEAQSEASTSDGKPARSRRNVNSRRGGK